MADVEYRTPAAVALMMIAAIIATIVIAVVVIRSTASLEPWSSGTSEAFATSKPGIAFGVRARLNVGGEHGTTVERTLPQLAVSLESGQSLDARVPAGAFKGEFVVTFNAGPAHQANIGAEIRNGSLIVMRSGEPPLLSDYAGNEDRLAMTRVPVQLDRPIQQFTFVLETKGGGPSRLRAVWQADGAEHSSRLPSDGAPLFDSDALRGMLLIQQFNCAACHRSGDAQLQASLDVSPAPVLEKIGSRARPEWIRRWIADPKSLNAQATMPRLFHGTTGDVNDIEDVTHFLVSMGGPIDESRAPADANLVAQGTVLYHEVGCVACHGPLEALETLPGSRKFIGYLTRSYTPLGALAEKTTVNSLAAFLNDPLSVWPGGRMPSMGLNQLEAKSIASYLMAREAGKNGPPADPPLVVDQSRAQRGRERFAVRGCANCHAPAADDANLPRRRASPLESLSDLLSSGCLASDDDAKSPRFPLDESQRHAIQAFLQSLPARRNNDVPLDRLACALTRLNCTACHSFHADPGPEAAMTQYFTVHGNGDSPEATNVPPSLTDVGARLDASQIRDVLVNGARARRYLNTRMPLYGERNVGHLPADFAAVAGVLPSDSTGAILESATVPASSRP